jgi:hypothetical protein
MFSQTRITIDDLAVSAKALSDAELEQVSGGVMQDLETGRTCTDARGTPLGNDGSLPEALLTPYGDVLRAS